MRELVGRAVFLSQNVHKADLFLIIAIFAKRMAKTERKNGEKYVKLKIVDVILRKSSYKERLMSGRNRRKSYFHKYLRSFMLILIVPFLTILLVYIQSQSIVREMILTSSRNTLNQYFKRVDGVFEDASEICVTVGTCQESRDYSTRAKLYPGKTAYQALIFKQRLQEYYGEAYSDIFVYFPDVEKIVSGPNASMQVNQYCDVFYGEEYWKDFSEVITQASGKASVDSMKGEDDSAYVCISMRLSARLGSQYDHVATVVLRKNYFSGLMGELAVGTDEGCFMLFGEDWELLISSQELEDEPEAALDGTEWYETEINGERYIVQTRASEKVNVHYAYAVPYRLFWGKLEKLQMFCGMGGLISVLLGVILAWIQTHRAYRPIGNMVEKLQDRKEVSYDASENNEFEFVERIFREEEQEKLAMDMAVRRGNEAMRSRYIAALLEGRAECRDAGEAELKAQGITLCSTWFQVGVIEIEQTGGLKPELLPFVIENVLSEICNEKHRVYMVPKQNKRIAMLLNIDPQGQTVEFFDLIHRGKDFLEERCGITFTCGISSVKQEIGEIPTAYAEAGLALKYRYLLGKEIIIEYAEIAGREFKYLPPLENKIYNKINQFIADGYLHMSSDMLVKQVLDDYGIDNNTSLETVECFKIEALSALNRVVMVGRYWDDFWEESVKRLIGGETQEEFICILSELLTELCRKQQEKDETEDVCKRAYEYIRENYADIQLSLKLLSEKLEISASYLSRLFKEKYCVSIPDYISHVRCDHAKEELRNTGLSVQKIAENNGFISADAFIKVFKKVEGVTPGGYRKLDESR